MLFMAHLLLMTQNSGSKQTFRYAFNFIALNKKAIAEAMTFYGFKYKLLDYCSLALSTLNKINMRTIQIGIIITDSLKP